MKISPDDLKKISYKSFCEKPFTGNENCCIPGSFFYIPRLQFTDSWESITSYKPESHSILFKDWYILTFCEYSPNKILATTLGNCMFIIIDFNVA